MEVERHIKFETDTKICSVYLPFIFASSAGNSELPEEMVLQIGEFTIGILFAVRVDSTAGGLSPIGLSFNALASLAIGIILVVKNFIAAVVLCVFICTSRDRGSDHKDILHFSRSIKLVSKFASLLVWILTCIYYLIQENLGVRARPQAITVFFALIVAILSLEFIINLCVTCQLVTVDEHSLNYRDDSGSRWQHTGNMITEKRLKWFHCLSFLVSFRDRIPLFLFWLLVFNNKEKSFQETRNYINNSDLLLGFAKGIAIWKCIIQIVYCATRTITGRHHSVAKQMFEVSVESLVP